MNVDTGELFRELGSAIDTGELFREHGSVEDLDSIHEVPEELEEEAEKALGDKDKVVIDLQADTPLANWARHQRAYHKNNTRKKRKMAKKSKQRNRR